VATYSVVIKRSAQKEIRNLPTKRLRQRVVAVIRALADDPRPPGCLKLTGADKYRLRTGRYRILYTIRDDEVIVTIVRVAHRSDAYR
jgi:mRNA interferase RelE/StbE